MLVDGTYPRTSSKHKHSVGIPKDGDGRGGTTFLPTFPPHLSIFFLDSLLFSLLFISVLALLTLSSLLPKLSSLPRVRACEHARNKSEDKHIPTRTFTAGRAKSVSLTEACADLSTHSIDVDVVVVVAMVECLEEALHLTQRAAVDGEEERDARRFHVLRDILGSHVPSVRVRSR